MARLLLALSIATASHFAAATPPNIVIFLADDLGYSDLGCYGSEIDTRHIDELAENGLRFSRFYGTGGGDATRAALLTGFYAQQIARDVLPGKPAILPGRRPTWAPLLPEALKAHGYRAYFAGKWRLDGSPLQGGFETSFEVSDTDRHFGLTNIAIDDVAIRSDTYDASKYSTTAIADEIILQLDRHHELAADQPFLAYVAFTAPRFPLQAPQQDIDKYRDCYIAGWDVVRQARYDRQRELGLVDSNLTDEDYDTDNASISHKFMQRLDKREVDRWMPWGRLTLYQQSYQAEKMAIHAAMVDRLDQEIGRVVARLKELGVFDNTLILVLSDNGVSDVITVAGDAHQPNALAGSADSYLSLGPGWAPCCNAPFRGRKVSVHEAGIASPLVVHWPIGIAQSGSIHDAPLHVIDIVPTLVTLADSNKQPNQSESPWAGVSFANVLAGGDEEPFRWLWWLHDGRSAMSNGEYKVIVDGHTGNIEMYDLQMDRAEAINIADQRQGIVRCFERQWQYHLWHFRVALEQSEQLAK